MIFLLDDNPDLRKGIFSRLFSRGMDVACFQKDGAELCKITVKSKNSIDWLRIQSMLSDGDCFIAANSIEVPIEIELPRPDGENALTEMLLDGVHKTVLQAYKSGVALSILLIDKEAKFVESMLKLCPICEQICILTNEKELYSVYTEKALTEFGASPLILDSTEHLSRCDIILAPLGISGCGALPLPKLIFSKYGSDCVTVCERCLSLPEIFDSINTDKFDKFMLADAILSCKEYTGALPECKNLKWRDKILTVAELSSVFYA